MTRQYRWVIITRGGWVQRNLRPGVWGRLIKEMIFELKPERGGASHRKLIPGRGDSRGKDHKARMSLVGSRNSKKPRVTGADK